MPIEVLLVADSPGDVRLTQEAFRDANRSVHLHAATDGVEAMWFANFWQARREDRFRVGSSPPGTDLYQ
jgi:hypothetical protein